MMTRILWLSLPCSSTPSQISTVFLFVLSSTLYMKNISWLNASCLSNLGTDPFKYYSPLKCPAVISAEPITPPLPLLTSPRIYIFFISLFLFFYFISILFYSFLFSLYSYPYLYHSFFSFSISFSFSLIPLALCRHPLFIVLSLSLLFYKILLYSTPPFYHYYIFYILLCYSYYFFISSFFILIAYSAC